jgi:hypothetical protein
MIAVVYIFTRRLVWTMNGLSDFLYASPSFLEGAASVLDLGDTLTDYNASLSGEQADRIALAMDWQAVGDDMRRAVAAFETELAAQGVDVPQEQRPRTPAAA